MTRIDPALRRLSIARLPPLNALRAFVLSVRHGSFAGAAEELLVSPAAIGQQIRLLEDHLGGVLFDRHRGRLELTPMGRQIAPGLEQAFARLAATLACRGAQPVGRLRLAVPSGFAAKWLVPRMDRLLAAAPGLDLVGPEDEADCAIALGPRKGWEPFLSESLICICRPDLRHRSDLPTLHDGLGEGDLRLPDSAAVIEATLAGRGAGVALARLAEADLAAGRLVALRPPVPLDRSWSLRGDAGPALLSWFRHEGSA